MLFQLSYPFLEFIEKMPGETEQDFYMYWSWGRVKMIRSEELDYQETQFSL